MPTNERYIDVVHLPEGVDKSALPDDVRKYLINVDGSDAGAYDGTNVAGWVQEGDQWKYQTPNGAFVTNSWIRVDEKSYYMNSDGIMLADTITPDGIYVNPHGEKVSYYPGWVQDGSKWRYVMKNGYYAASTWVQDTDGKWYYFDIAAYMDTDSVTPDGFYVDANGVWDGNASSIENQANPGPGEILDTPAEGWEASGDTWRYRQKDGSYITNAWVQDTDGKWYYFDESSLMVRNQTTSDGYYVGEDGVWTETE